MLQDVDEAKVYSHVLIRFQKGWAYFHKWHDLT